MKHLSCDSFFYITQELRVEVSVTNIGDRMGMLSDTSIKHRIFQDSNIDSAKLWFQNRDWSLIKDRILIDPFTEDCLGPFNYDLHLGEEAYSVNKRKIIQITKPDFVFEPNEMLLVISREYIGLPRTIATTILPRFSLVQKGLQISMTKIDPTWYGRIAIGMINLSKMELKLKSDISICTLVFHSLSEPCSTILNEENCRALGKETIDYFIDN